jgi:uncharacterized protein with HEPN domain
MTGNASTTSALPSMHPRARDQRRPRDGLVFDAVRVRLIEIGEVVKALSPELLAHEPNIPWKEIAGMRDRLAHRYFDTYHAVVQGTVNNDLPELQDAVDRLYSRIPDTDTHT